LKTGQSLIKLQAYKKCASFRGHPVELREMKKTEFNITKLIQYYKH